MNESIDLATVPHFYHMVAGQVGFLRPGSENVEVAILNTLAITNPDGRISAKHIGLIQQGLQRNLRDRLGEEVPKVIDVVILSISPLGVFTKAEFESGSLLEKMNQDAKPN